MRRVVYHNIFMPRVVPRAMPFALHVMFNVMRYVSASTHSSYSNFGLFFHLAITCQMKEHMIIHVMIIIIIVMIIFQSLMGYQKQISLAICRTNRRKNEKDNIIKGRERGVLKFAKTNWKFKDKSS